ncbi:MAG: guanylate kinase [Clostridia bacterium]
MKKIENKGLILVVSGPSGTGKDTIVNEILEHHLPDETYVSISMTTRKPRDGEIDGVHYHFVDVAEFEKRIKNKEMLEYAKYGSNYYGTPLEPIKQMTAEGKVVILIIEVQGAQLVKNLLPRARRIFIAPPSLEVLEQRLRTRGTETEEAITKRMQITQTELTYIKDYDYVVENDVLSEAVEDVMTIIKAEKLKTINKKIYY